MEFPPLRVADSEASEPEGSAVLERLVQGRLVARGGELKQLKHRWNLARQAHGHLFMLSGEPGIGKTRLALELITQAHKDGAAILIALRAAAPAQ